tara:strand:+ start:1370 stop:1543 length:174 start_codon:yes stop_codon:yes gene_type:complete
MTEYKIMMIETESIQREYTVEADSLGEAELKALKGETVEELTLNHLGVESREFDLEQ